MFVERQTDNTRVPIKQTNEQSCKSAWVWISSSEGWQKAEDRVPINESSAFEEEDGAPHPDKYDVIVLVHRDYLVVPEHIQRAGQGRRSKGKGKGKRARARQKRRTRNHPIASANGMRTSRLAKMGCHVAS